MTTLADLNGLWPADHNATPWVATRDGSWTRMVGAGVNPETRGRKKRGVRTFWRVQLTLCLRRPLARPRRGRSARRMGER
jgi:hypothetical protein